MKIAYIAHNRFPTEKAHGVQISAMCNAFTENGASVTLVVMRYVINGKATIQEIREKHSIANKVNIISLFLPFIIYLGKVGYITQVTLFTLRTFLIKAVLGADVIFTRDEIIAAAWSLAGKKVIFEAHTHRGGFWWKIIARKAHIISISGGLKTAILLKAPYAQCRVFHDSVDIEKFNIKETRVQARQKLGIGGGGKLIVYTGHLYERKGVHTLLDGFMQLQEKNTISSTLYMIGGTEHDVRRFKREYATESIIFVGHVEHSKVPLYIRAADVAVIPNSGKDLISSTYTSPLKLFEYMASGVEIVTSRVPAIQEVVDDESVYFMEPDSSNSCCEALELALSAKLHKGAEAQRVVQNYSWKARAYGIMQALQ